MSFAATHFSPIGRLRLATEIATTLNTLAKDAIAQTNGWKATERGGKVFVRGLHPTYGRELKIEVKESDGRYIFATKKPFMPLHTTADPIAKTTYNMAHMVLGNILARLDN